MTESESHSRWEGCLLGLAVGDALRAPLEFHLRIPGHRDRPFRSIVTDHSGPT